MSTDVGPQAPGKPKKTGSRRAQPEASPIAQPA